MSARRPLTVPPITFATPLLYCLYCLYCPPLSSPVSHHPIHSLPLLHFYSLSPALLFHLIRNFFPLPVIVNIYISCYHQHNPSDFLHLPTHSGIYIYISIHLSSFLPTYTLPLKPTQSPLVYQSVLIRSLSLQLPPSLTI